MDITGRRQSDIIKGFEFNIPVDMVVTALGYQPDYNLLISQGLIVNKEGFGFYVKYKKSQLPYFIEWKMMGEGTYTVGLEPANCLVETREKMRRKGTLPFLRSREKREYLLEIGVIK